MENKIVVTLIIVILVIFFFMVNESRLDEQVIFASFILSEKTGFDLTPGELTFGKIRINQGATRDITISNNFDKPILILIESSGTISKNLIVSENNFRLNPGESKSITFSVYTKGLTEFKEYSGNVIIISKKT